MDAEVDFFLRLLSFCSYSLQMHWLDGHLQLIWITSLSLGHSTVICFRDSISSMLRSRRDFKVNKTQGIPSVVTFALDTCLFWAAHLSSLTSSRLVCFRLIFLKWNIEDNIKRTKFLIKERESRRGEGQETKVVCLWGRNSGPGGSGIPWVAFRITLENTIVDKPGYLQFLEQTINSETNRAFYEV